MPVRNVHQHRTLRRELVLVDTHRLLCRQMDGNRIRGIGIDDDEVVKSVGLLGEGQPCVTDHRLETGLATLDEGEIFRIARGIDHGLVDLEEPPVFARLRGAGQRTGTEADDGDTNGSTLACANRADGAADTSVLVIIRDRLRPSGHRRAVVVLHPLGAVDRGAVHQYVILAAGGDHDLVNAEEAAHRFHPPVVGGVNAQQYQRQHHRRRDLRAAGMRHDRKDHRQYRASSDNADALLFYPVERAARRESRHQPHDCKNGQHQPIPAQKPAPPLLGKRATQHGQCDQDRIFGNPRERERRDQAGEQSAQHAAERQRNVKARQISCRGARAGEFAVTGHGDDEEAELMAAQRQQQVLLAADRQQDNHACNRRRLQQQHQPVRQQRTRLEHQHPRQKVQRQRQHPQQRRGRYVSGNMRGHCDQQTRRDRG